MSVSLYVDTQEFNLVGRPRLPANRATIMAMQLSLKETRVGLLNSTTRIPFRYGKACLTRCPQAIVRVLIEADGKRQAGYSGDCLPPSWFDKSPDKDYAQGKHPPTVPRD